MGDVTQSPGKLDHSLRLTPLHGRSEGCDSSLLAPRALSESCRRTQARGAAERAGVGAAGDLRKTTSRQLWSDSMPEFQAALTTPEGKNALANQPTYLGMNRTHMGSSVWQHLCGTTCWSKMAIRGNHLQSPAS